MTPKQQRFVEEYLIDLNATQAAIRAGYAERGAEVAGHRLLRNAKILPEIERRTQELSEKTEITQEFVLNGLRENYARAMQQEAVLDREGKPTGEYRYEGSVANRALELLGKHLSMFTDVSKVNLGDGWADVMGVVDKPHEAPVRANGQRANGQTNGHGSTATESD